GLARPGTDAAGPSKTVPVAVPRRRLAWGLGLVALAGIAAALVLLLGGAALLWPNFFRPPGNVQVVKDDKPIADMDVPGRPVAGPERVEPEPVATVQVEIEDPNIKVTFDEDGPTVTGAEKASIALKPGEHGMVVTRGNFTLRPDKFSIEKGEKV